MNNRNLIRSTAVVSAGTGLSRILGLVREIFMARLFGTSLAKSAFDIAFLIPNLFRRLFGEGALSAAFVPVFAESIEKEGVESANRLAGKVMTMLGTALAAIVIGGILLATVSIKFLTLGEKAAAVLPLLRIMLPYMFFICLVAFCMAILNSFHHFAVPAVTPVLLNVVWIVTLIFICPRFGNTPGERIYGAAWGILAAGGIQLLIQVPVLLRFGFRPRASFAWRDEKLIRILLLMGPMALGMGVFQVNLCIDRLLAFMVGTWAPAALTYAERLIYLPLGVFATALGTVLLPTFSRQAAREKKDEIRATLGVALRNLMLVMMPAAIGLLVLAVPVVRLVFAGGEFGDRSTVLTARALMFYAPGLVVFSLHKVFIPAFYALKDTRTPVRVGLRVVALNFMLNIIFILTWPLEYKHAGLAFATVLAGAVNCLALGRILHQRVGTPGWSRIIRSWIRIFVASLVMGLAVSPTHKFLAGAVTGAGLDAKSGQLLAVAGSIIVGLLVYCGLAALLCRQEVREILSSKK